MLISAALVVEECGLQKKWGMDKVRTTSIDISLYIHRYIDIDSDIKTDIDINIDIDIDIGLELGLTRSEVRVGPRC